MTDVYQEYEWLDAVLPPSVYRDVAEQDYAAGEPESAIANLLEDALEEGAVTPEIVQRLKREYSSDPFIGPVIEICERKLAAGELS
ncbi:hypothetical protein F7232_04670 [Corynebacterium sp. 319]|uniref:hypothetical protein n=1 Tax=unclassified Corynebacterium TaxID=2624378 RepID=UPI00125CD291|nr:MULTISPECIES: hypothetical protein [unclassified Corynebacterium]KAB1554259.1 hypothetical protein F7232_04670 [Corynebacterium sp. 319]KAB3539997.1 hypothetical protein F8390_01660 [Corynebacterium sp. 366]